MKKLNQKGFGVIEALLSIIALTLIIGVGVYVVNVNKDKNKETDSTIQPRQSESTEEKYIEFKNLGVKIEANDSTNKFTYTEDGESVVVRSSELKALTDKVCSPDSDGDGTVAIIGIIEGTFNQDETVTALAKQFPDFALINSGPPNGFVCGTTDEANQQVSTKTQELSSAAHSIFEKAEEIKN